MLCILFCSPIKLKGFSFLVLLSHFLFTYIPNSLISQRVISSFICNAYWYIGLLYSGLCFCIHFSVLMSAAKNKKYTLCICPHKQRLSHKGSSLWNRSHYDIFFTTLALHLIILFIIIIICVFKVPLLIQIMHISK